ncbi:MAG TPA: hypothetical protein VIJ75_08530 [Hanamia sp.]
MKKVFLSFLLLLLIATGYAQNYPDSYTDGKYVEVTVQNYMWYWSDTATR